MASRLLQESIKELVKKAAKRTTQDIGAAGNIGEVRRDLRHILEEAGLPNASGELDVLQSLIVRFHGEAMKEIKRLHAEKDELIQRERTMRKTIAKQVGAIPR